ncbi:MAG: protein kinase [Myxococcales bacterium]|nr:protein kinase [Myxococcales bacterium]
MTSLPEYIGRYEILGLLGSGGMAEILLARLHGPGQFERPVVIKRILPHLAREQRFVRMFRDEARLIAGVHHQNVVQVQDFGLDQGELYIAMEYLEGENTSSLARRLAGSQRILKFGLCAYLIAEVAAGLHAAHEAKDRTGVSKNLVHRDVSPANVFITYDGCVKILDFGIAVSADRESHTEVGQVKGKYAYMSPEQCMGRPVDRRSDIFSLGIVLYELSTCRRLFKRKSDMLTLQAICHDIAPSPVASIPEYPQALERICLRALAKSPAERYQTALEMRRDLLVLARELNGEKLPEVSLGKVMRRLFADRIEEKHLLLTKIRKGEEVTSLPASDLDSSFEVEVVEDEGAEVGYALPFENVDGPTILGEVSNGSYLRGEDADSRAPLSSPSLVSSSSSMATLRDEAFEQTPEQSVSIAEVIEPSHPIAQPLIQEVPQFSDCAEPRCLSKPPRAASLRHEATVGAGSSSLAPDRRDSGPMICSVPSSFLGAELSALLHNHYRGYLWVAGILVLLVSLIVGLSDNEKLSVTQEQKILLAEPEFEAASIRSTVALKLDTVPRGAHVVLDGLPRGQTPIVVDVERSAYPLGLTLSIDGYLDYIDEVVPDRDLQMRLILLGTEQTKKSVLRRWHRNVSRVRVNPSTRSNSMVKPSLVRRKVPVLPKISTPPKPSPKKGASEGRERSLPLEVSQPQLPAEATTKGASSPVDDASVAL